MLPFLIGGGLLVVAAASLFASSGTGEHEPDLPSPPPSPPGQLPSTTRYRLVDKILPQLKAAAARSGIPLGLLIGWIARESGGKLADTTSLNERGLFQLMPSESSSLNLDHNRLSTDLDYSIEAGLLLIAKYMREADTLAIAQHGTPYYWRLVKLIHTIGSGATKKVVTAAKADNDTGTWDLLEQHALDHTPKYTKWFRLVDNVYDVGAPFGFGDTATVLVGAALYDDIPDPLDYL